MALSQPGGVPHADGLDGFVRGLDTPGELQILGARARHDLARGAFVRVTAVDASDVRSVGGITRV